MRVLVVKMSSLGDVVHTLPALTDAHRARPELRFNWLVEEGFAEIPGWHPAVERVVPVAIRRWRKTPLASWRSGEPSRCRATVRAAGYDLVIDAQGLIKSAWAARWARAPIAGLDRHSAREPLAALAYRQQVAVPREMHAVERTRQLFAAALGYDKPVTQGDYRLDHSRFPAVERGEAPRVVFLHGTTRADKHWPERYWRILAEQATSAGIEVFLPWGNATEEQRAQRTAAGLPGARVLPRLTLAGVAAQLLAADAVVAVDTGLAHLAAALDRPTIALYGPTRPALVGTYGRHQIHLVAGEQPAVTGQDDIEPRAMALLTPEHVWSELGTLLATTRLAGGGAAIGPTGH